MFQKSEYPANKQEAYALVYDQLTHLMEKQIPWLSNLSNFVGLLGQFLPDINWVGFYLLNQSTLYLGPFMGLPACTTIAVGNGVCGTAVEKRTTLVVPNVHEFPKHIACDSASNSEIVIPLKKGNQIIGVLDIDSPKFNRFDEIDQNHLEKMIELLMKYYH